MSTMRPRSASESAEAIEELYADRLAEHYAVLAHHFMRAEDWARAADYFEKAADHAAAAFAIHEALALCDRFTCLAVGPPLILLHTDAAHIFHVIYLF